MEARMAMHTRVAPHLMIAAIGAVGSTLLVAQPPAAAASRKPVINVSADPLLAPFRFRSIGPASMGGRIDDIEVAATNPSIIYVGYAVGGLWKSENNGTTFAPVFDTYGTASIGDIAIHPTNPDIVYVGTGEANNRQTSTFGDGLYKTTDGGKTFTRVGLRETQSIARIIIDPRNPEIVYVAAPGHLFGPSPDRGVYKTTDGGRTWNKVKYIDDNTGFTDIAMDPSNSNVLYAASYQRRRMGCCFSGGGPGSALWKSEDAGRTWAKLSGAGLPAGTYGRIALDVSRSNPNVVFAQIEAGESNTIAVARGGAPNAANSEATPGAPAAPPVTPGNRPGQGGGGGGGFNWCNNAGPGGGFPALGGAPGGTPPAPTRVPPGLDATRGGVYRSADKGRTWTLVSNCNARPMYFSQLRVDPSNENTIYVAGLPVAKSLDGGKTFATLDAAGGHGDPAHVDQHAIWIDPKNSNHVMIGNDGGLDISWDQGKTWDFVNTMATGLAYVVTADMRRPYYVYVGLQDNGSWGAPSATRSRLGIVNSDWFRIGGGDGFYTAVDPSDWTTVYSESQNGNTNRTDLRTGRVQSIRPRAPGPAGGPPPAGGGAGGGGSGGGGGGGGGGGQPNVTNATPGDVYRFNWNTPYIISPHNASTIWLGGNRLFKSTDRGNTWTASADLTKQVDRATIPIMGVPGDRTMLSKHDGVTAYSTIVSVSESPVAAGVVWAGTDDGLVQVSRDGGATFSEVGKNLPGLPRDQQYWISRIDASHFDAATAYLSVDGHRSDDLEPYVFVTHDYGAHWQSLTSNLPAYGNVQVVREDPKNRDLLYVGSEFGLYISTNAGREWKRFMSDLPTVRVDDILVHPRDGDLIVATHGRSVFIADDITPLQQLTPAVLGQDAVLFDIRPAVAYLTDVTLTQQIGGQKVFVGENAARGTAISYYLKAPASGDVKVAIADASGRVVRTLDGTKTAGLNRVMWNLAPTGRPGGVGGGGGGGGGGGFGNVPSVEPGTYTVTVTVDGRTLSKPLVVLEDKWMGER
jgi:photosystem II stability/assembly factor-like uncharacterized protein